VCLQDDVLSKPFRIPDLLPKIEEVCVESSRFLCLLSVLADWALHSLWRDTPCRQGQRSPEDLAASGLSTIIIIDGPHEHDTLNR
jgi:hypothetical protein